MSFVTTQLVLMTVAAATSDGSGQAIRDRNATAAAPTIGAAPVAADQVSAPTVPRFVAHAARYQAVNAGAVAVHDLCVITLGTSAVACAGAEDINVIARG